jgi:hypothetical protein
MNDKIYSWHLINKILRAQYDRDALGFPLDDADVASECNDLCEEMEH